MEGKRLIEKIRLRNILSFGDQGEEIELQPLNIIIGQNASGKSNLVDVISFLRDLWRGENLASSISRSGGINEWLWKGKKTEHFAEIKVQIEGYNDNDANEYELSFNNGMFGDSFSIIEEKIKSRNQKEFLTREQYTEEYKRVRKFTSDESFLSRYHNIHFKGIELTYYDFKHLFEEIKVYSNLQTNRNAEIRRPQAIDAPKEFLEEDGSNLSLILNVLDRKGHTKDSIIENLRKFYPKIKDYSFEFTGEYIQFYLREENLMKVVSAMRLSDGTLRYLCLLAILCNPEPPSLICIEEPETGLHPDILPTIAELMKEAAQRTQLIVTTHSDILVSAFSDMPEAVMVCEKDEDGTHFKRLEADKLKVWLEEYTLGEAWLRGAIGGTRW
jgi:predicted ATPase